MDVKAKIPGVGEEVRPFPVPPVLPKLMMGFQGRLWT